jgi:predicted nucleotidyltransferase
MSVQSGLGITDLLADKRAEILRLAAQHGASNVRVFGSVARSEAGPDSDIDFLVDFRPDYTLWDHIGLKQSLENLLGRSVHVALEKNLRDDFRPSILHDAVSL